MKWWHAGVAAGLGVAFATLLMLRQSGPTPVIEVPSADMLVHSTVTRPARATTTTQARAPIAPVVTAQTPHEEGLLAAIAQSGEGMVRCQLPSNTPIDLDRLNWAGQHNDVLTMATAEPAGSVHLVRHEPQPELPDDPSLADRFEHRDAVQAWRERNSKPFAMAEWSTAWPGTIGRCAVHELNERVALTVQLNDRRGDPLTAGVLWSDGEVVRVGDDGRGTVLVWPNIEHTIRAMGAGPQGKLIGETTRITEADSLVTIALAPTQPTESASSGDQSIDNFVSDHETFMEEHNRYLLAALDRGGLSAGARGQLQAWIEREERNSDQFYDVISNMEDPSVRTDR